MSPSFHPFVLPFTIGTLALFSILIIKYNRWISKFDRQQKKLIRRNLFTGKLVPAVWEMIREGLFHVKVSKHSRRLGYMHRSIALGWFLLISIGFIETVFHFKGQGHAPWIGVFFRFFVRENQTLSAQIFAQVMDLLLLYILSGVAMAVFKSVFSKTVGMRKTTRLKLFDASLRYSLWSIFPLRLLSESATAALVDNGGFLTQGLGNVMGERFAGIMELPFWTLYSIALGLFLCLLPFSRYAHIFSELMLIYFRKLGLREREKPTGFTQFELSACSRCGICIDNCPLDSELDITDIQPVYLIRDMRNRMPHHNAIDNCLMCNRCESDCPVGIQISEIRRQERDKKELDTHDNYGYIEDVQAFNAIGRVIYFGGCMSHLTPGVTESMKKIFEAVGQKYWMMDEDRTICCGRPLLQQGFFNQAAELRRKNTQLIMESRSKTLVTSCPICYQSFRKEYNLPIKVVHHTEYIATMLRLGKLKLNRSELRLAYHDPCELGRGCGIYDEPREVLSALGQLLKLEQERKDSLCCGYNLGDTVLELNQQLKVRDASLNNLSDAHPDVIATACPLCKKAFQHSTTQKIKDVAELVVENLR